MNEFSYVGKKISRIDGIEKATGKLAYMTDLEFPNALIGKIFRSEYPHALIKKIDKEEALAVEGVRYILTAEDIPGDNTIGIEKFDQPILTNKARFLGEPVALVLAETEEQAMEALKKLKVEYEMLEPIFDPETALSADDNLIHETGNLLRCFETEIGDPESAFKEADVIIENTYETSWQEHAFLETEGGYGVPGEDGSVIIYCPNQQGHYSSYILSRVFDLPAEKVIMRSSPIGGGFGRKCDVDIPGLLGLGALKAQRPVFIHLTREESFATGYKRQPFKMTIKTGVKRDGTFLVQDVYVLCDTGAYSSFGSAVMGFGLENSAGTYFYPNYKLKGHCMYTNNIISGAFRGFGNKQISFANESQIDIIAQKLGIDPIKLRELNCVKPGQRHTLGQSIASSNGILDCLEAAKKSKLWQNRDEFKNGAKEPWLKRGVGVALCQHGNGLGLGFPGGDGSGAKVEATEDGKFNVYIRSEEMGQGSITTFSIIAAEELGVDLAMVNIICGDTSRTLDAGPTTAARSTLISGGVVKGAARIIKNRIKYYGAQILKVTVEDVTIAGDQIKAKNGRVAQLSDVNKKLLALGLAQASFKNVIPETDIEPEHGIGLHYIHSYSACVAGVEVNTLTGKTDVLEMETITDAGKVINPLGYEGQAEGGTVMGLGYAIMEDFKLNDGKVLSKNFQTYLIPTIADIPDIKVTPVEVLEETGPWGAKGLGEIINSISPAITNAIADATGVRIADLPASPEKVHNLLKERNKV